MNAQGEFLKPCVCAKSTKRSNFYPVTPHACKEKTRAVCAAVHGAQAVPGLRTPTTIAVSCEVRVGLPHRLHGPAAAGLAYSAPPHRAAPGDKARAGNTRRLPEPSQREPPRLLLRSLRHCCFSRASVPLRRPPGATAAHHAVRRGQKYSTVPIHSSDTFSQILSLSLFLIFKAQL